MAVLALNSKVPEVAAASLHNLVAGIDDPAELKKDDVDAIVEKLVVLSFVLSFFEFSIFDWIITWCSRVLRSGMDLVVN